MTEQPLNNPDMMLMRERLRAVAKTTAELAAKMKTSEVVEDSEYAAGMLLLQSRQLLAQADALEDDDDITKVDMFITHRELENARLGRSLDEVGHLKRASRRLAPPPIWALQVLLGLTLLGLGYTIGAAVTRLVLSTP